MANCCHENNITTIFIFIDQYYWFFVISFCRIFLFISIIVFTHFFNEYFKKTISIRLTSLLTSFVKGNIKLCDILIFKRIKPLDLISKSQPANNFHSFVRSERSFVCSSDHPLETLVFPVCYFYNHKMQYFVGLLYPYVFKSWVIRTTLCMTQFRFANIICYRPFYGKYCLFGDHSPWSASYPLHFRVYYSVRQETIYCISRQHCAICFCSFLSGNVYAKSMVPLSSNQFSIFEGHHSLVSKMSERLQHIEVATPPFCCVFPCLPKVQLERFPLILFILVLLDFYLSRKVRICEWMVLQAPCVRLFATLASLIIYFEYQDKGLIPLKVLDFITLPSLLGGIYGTHILVTTVSRLDELISYRYIVVFRLLDFFFMFFGLQQPVFDFLARYGIFGCGSILPAIETSFFWKNFFTVLEAFFVTLISTVLVHPSKSSFFDKHPSCRSIASSANSHTTETSA
uniref:Phosphatidate cytidylyltransferase n=1 Tax=Heterorhabditis bacteriophora TaxID=37862 RepID=A0A1I7WRB9_HETBA